MTKKIYILLIVVLGFLLAPITTYACGKSSNKIEQHCSSKKKSHKHSADHKTVHKDDLGCKENPCDKHKGDCDGKCGHSSCHCVTFHPGSLFIPQYIDTEYKAFSVEREQKFSYTQAHISSGFHSIWLPPDIS